MSITEFPPIPDPAYAKGVSAPFCGYEGDALIVAGGANFPDKPLLEGGAKKVYNDIWAFSEGAWHHAGFLRDSVAYGATFAVPGGLVLAGGDVDGRPVADVFFLRLEDGKAVLDTLPPLPEPMEQAGASRYGNTLYLAGGVGTTAVYACSTDDYIWHKIASLPEPLVQPVAFAASGALFVWGGFNPQTLAVSPQGIVLRDGAWAGAPDIPDGGTFVGTTGVTLPDGRLAVVGGVNRDIFARALHNTPEDRIPYLSQEPAAYKFRSEVWIFDPAALRWKSLGADPACALAGPGVAVSPDGALAVAGGELKPGVRSPKIFKIQ